MAKKLCIALAIGSLLCLTAAANANAAPDVIHQKVVDQPERTATASVLIAPPTACPNQIGLSKPVTNFARANAGLGELADAEELDASAEGKAEDVLRCDSFSHFACGREFTYWIRTAGYIGEGCWHAGENLAWGAGEYGSVRAIFRAWMSSPTHRQNILGDYSQVGISLETGELEGHSAAHVWAAHFGSRCED